MSEYCYDKELLEGGIVVYRLRKTSRECMDLWFEDVSNVFESSLAQDNSVRLLYDVRALTVPTPYSLERAQALADLPLPEDWRVATVTGTGFATGLINLIRSASLLSHEMYERSRVFSAERDAIAWLREP